MTLRQTTRVIAGIAAVACVGCFYAASEWLLAGEPVSLEAQAVRDRLDRSVYAYERALDALDRLAGDIAAGQAEANDTGVLAVVLDADGDILATTGPDAAGVHPADLSAELRGAGVLGRSARGLLALDSGTVALAVSASDNRTVVVADRLDDTLLAAGAPTRLLTRQSPDWPGEAGSTTRITPRDHRTITGLHPITDLFGRTAAFLQVDLPRTYSQAATRTRNATFLFFGLFTFGAAALVVTAARRTVIAPIEDLGDRLSRIARNGGGEERIDLPPSEELARLTEQVNDMLSRIRRSETDMIRTERLRVAGELSAGVSHNLNNILTGILGPAEYLEQNVERPDLLAEAQRIHRAAIRARDLVARFSQAVRLGTPIRSRAVPVNGIVEQAIEAARPRWQDEAQGRGVQIAIETDLQATVPIQGTPDELYDILVNLLMNAVDAILSVDPPISTDAPVHTIRVTTADDEGRVIVSVTDDGIGMSRDNLARVFEPFFTTKATIGAGLGLAAAHGIVRRWGGTINVDSEAGEGATFTMALPRSWETLATTSADKPDPDRRGRILIVEDDPVVRDVLRASLSDLHELTIVDDGQQGIDAVAAGRFDVALIDLSLPQVPGDRVARHIRRTDPQVVTVLMTGWDLSEDDPRRAPFDDHVPKPIVSRADVRDIVSRSLMVHDARRLRS